MNEELVFRLHGNGISPSSFRSKDLGEILIHFEDSIKSVLKEIEPDIKEEEILLSVVELEDKSLGIKYAPNIKPLVVAFGMIASSFGNDNFDLLPSKSLDHLREVQTKVRKYNCAGEFKINGDSIGELKVDTDIKISDNLKLKGETTIYGKIVRVGGVEPRVRIELLEGYTITALVSESLAQEIAQDLYTIVSLNGNAVWNTRDNQIIEFKAESRGEYRYSSNKESFTQLQAVLGEYWDGIDNIEETLKETNG